MELSLIFANLPDELIALIFSFGIQMKYRKGKFVGQIVPEDPRRNMLNKRILPTFIPNVLYLHDDDINYHMDDRTQRFYVSLKKEKKEMILYYFTQNHINYFNYINLSKGRMIGYVYSYLYEIKEAGESPSYVIYYPLDKNFSPLH